MSKTFLSVVNSAILESGADLDQFETDGSDWDSTTNDSLMRKFKVWVNRAWQTVQQNAYDWEWMSEQAVVNIVPGIMFYSAIPFRWTVDDANPLVIKEVDGTTYWEGLVATKLVNLTGQYTNLENFGYIDIKYSDYSYTNQHALDQGLKTGGNYFESLSETGQKVQLTAFNQTINASTSNAIYGIRFVNTLSGSTTTIDTLTDSSFISVVNITNSGTAIIKFDENKYDEIVEAMSYTDGQLVDVEVRLTEASSTWTTVVSGLSNPDLVTGDSPWYSFETISVDPLTMVLLGYIDFPNIPSVGDTIAQISVYTVDMDDNAHTENFTNAGEVVSIDNSGLLENNTMSVAITNSAIKAYIDQVVAGEYVQVGVTLRKVADSIDNAIVDLIGDPFNSNDTELTWEEASPVTLKNYIHSWKSFDWGEELNDDDFVESVAEIDEQSFRLVTHEIPSSGLEIKLPFMHWEIFRAYYDNTAIPPNQPRIVTKDNTGRWRFYPAPDRPYTILFDYVRNPQQLVAFDDIIKGIPDDFIDIIVMRTLIYYGEYDEQPSVVQRATRNYKDLMFRLEMRFRDKFHFVPARLW